MKEGRMDGASEGGRIECGRWAGGREGENEIRRGR